MSTPRRGRQVLLLAVSALTQVVTYVVRPTATYRAIELDVPRGWLGVLAASFAIMPLVLALPSGALTDRCGERWVAVNGGLVLTGSTLVLGGNGPIPNTDAVFIAGGLVSVALTALSMGLQRVPSRAARTSSDAAGSVRTLLRLPGLLGALAGRRQLLVASTVVAASARCCGPALATARADHGSPSDGPGFGRRSVRDGRLARRCRGHRPEHSPAPPCTRPRCDLGEAR